MKVHFEIGHADDASGRRRFWLQIRTNTHGRVTPIASRLFDSAEALLDAFELSAGDTYGAEYAIIPMPFIPSNAVAFADA